MSNRHSMLPPIALPYPVQPQPMYDVASGFQGVPTGGPFPAGVGPTSSATGGPAPQGQPVSMMAPPYIGFAPAQQPPMAPPPYGESTDPAYRKPYEPVSGTSPGNGENGDRAPLDDCTGFSSKEIRQAFVRKVYAILMVQLTITFGAVALFIYEPHVKSFVQNNGAVYISAYISFIVMYIALICCKGLRRSYPANIIMLFLFTLVMSYLVGVISSFHSTDTVLIAAGICAACCLAVSIFSCHSKFDFTSCAGFLFIAVWILLLFGILTLFTYNTILNTVYSALGALLFMAFLAFDTQMIMGGRKLELSPEEHIYAALQLYMDVVQLFLFILRLVSAGRR